MRLYRCAGSIHPLEILKDFKLVRSMNSLTIWTRNEHKHLFPYITMKVLNSYLNLDELGIIMDSSPATVIEGEVIIAMYNLPTEEALIASIELEQISEERKKFLKGVSYYEELITTSKLLNRIPKIRKETWFLY